MLLYATTKSERASKGQGGNEYLEIELSIDDGNITLGEIYLDINEDIKNHGTTENEWVLQWKTAGAIDPTIIAQGHYIPKQKGEKLKTAKCEFCNQKATHAGACVITLSLQ